MVPSHRPGRSIKRFHPARCTQTRDSGISSTRVADTRVVSTVFFHGNIPVSAADRSSSTAHGTLNRGRYTRGHVTLLRTHPLQPLGSTYFPALQAHLPRHRSSAQHVAGEHEHWVASASRLPRPGVAVAPRRNRREWRRRPWTRALLHPNPPFFLLYSCFLLATSVAGDFAGLSET